MKTVRVIDVETTGLDPAVHRVVEVATVDLEMPSGDEASWLPRRGRMWSSLVNPWMHVPPEASAIHDITDEMLDGAPDIAGVIPHIIEMPFDYYCAHNSRFDRKFIDPIKDLPWIDTYRVALWLWPQAPDHKNATLRYWLRLKLDAAVAGIGIDGIARSHRALWDAYVTAAILRRAILDGATIEEMVQVSSQPATLPKFTFGKHAMQPIAEVPDGYLDWIIGEKGMDEDVRHTAFTELTRRRTTNGRA
jgi:exodeoxyribonuclease X